ncbi:MAG: zf-HC2 domain-containing protein [Ktedonobacteraceae bacterium]
MRCRDARLWLAAQRDGDLVEADELKLQEHLKQCPACRTFEQRQHFLNTLLLSPTPRSYSSISTERIMLAVERQQRISRQLQDIHAQQQSRIARMRGIGAFLAAITFFTLGSIPLLLLALTIVQPDLLEKTLSLLGDGVGALIVFAEYLQTGLTLVSSDNRLLLSTALVVVVMMGMWLRLMRHPQQA